jgi:hypothetical protein
MLAILLTVVLYLNGLAVAVIELKRSSLRRHARSKGARTVGLRRPYTSCSTASCTAA